MSSKYLNDSGLAYFWTKIKAYIAGLLGAKADDADVVHKAGDEDVTGTKTFIGSKKIAFRQSAANDKLGFTLYNNSNVEKGYLEYNPTNQISGVPLMTLGNYATAAAGRAYVGFRKYSSISGAAGAYNLLTPLVSDAKAPFNLTTAYTNFFLPLGVTDGTATVVTDKSGLLDISPLIPSTFASDAVVAMTGYSKPGSGGAIAAGDSLNAAIGKLEFKVDSVDDSNYVHLTGNETIAGTKTFSNTISGSIDGNAATATKLATVRTISAGNLEFQGSANFDGSGNINLDITQHRSIVNVGNTNNYPFHRIAYTAVETGNYLDRAITFFVAREYISGGYGICRITLRTNNASGGAVAQCDVKWLVRTSDIPLDAIQVGFNNTAASSYIDVFYKSSGTYACSICRVLSHSNKRNSVGRGFTVVSDSTEVSNTTASDSLTSVESYATIADAGTKLHNKAYTSTITASDSGVVKSATDSTKLPLAGGTVTGNIIAASGAAFNQYHPSYIKGNSYSSNVFLGQGWYDKNGTVLADLLYYLNAPANDGNAWIGFRLGGNPNYNSSADATLGVMVTSSGQTFATCPTPSSTTDNSTKIATTAWIRTATGNTALNAASATKLANARTINGVSFNGTANITVADSTKVSKSGDTMTGELTVSNHHIVCINGAFIAKNTNFDKNVIPTSNSAYYSYSLHDKNSVEWARLLHYQNQNGGRGFSLDLSRKVNTGALVTMLSAYASVNESTPKFYLESGSDVDYFRPSTSNKTYCGTSDRRWKEIWCQQSSINSSSDERIKSNIKSIPDNVLDAWENVSWIEFQYNDAIEEKGENARLHTGLIAQRVASVFEQEKVSVDRYGFYLFDKWDAEEATFDEQGRKLRPAAEAGDMYGIRYTEALCMEAAYQRRENARLKKRIAGLEERLAALELKVS